MAMKPLYDRVIVRRLDSEETTKGGIIIPESAKEKPLEGKVISTGDGKLLDNGELRKLAVGSGDKILFGKYGGTEIKVEGKDEIADLGEAISRMQESIRLALERLRR